MHTDGACGVSRSLTPTQISIEAVGDDYGMN